MSNQLAQRSPQMQVRQQKKERKEEILAMCCHRYVNWAAASPTSSTMGLDTDSHFPGKGNKPPISHCPLSIWQVGATGAVVQS